MASPDRSIPSRPEPTASPRQPAALTDDVLEEIFLRVASHADLARASAACVSFRRLIADPNFLRRFRSRHPPLLLGFLSASGQGFLPAEAPHPNAPAARALGSAAGFSIDYPTRRGGLKDWYPRDVCDGRVLLGQWNSALRLVWGVFAVCDPLSRQYMLLPRIPEDLIASVQIKEGNVNDFGASLVPSGDWEETSFRVLNAIHDGTRFVVCVFSSISGCWSAGASTSWDALSLDPPPSDLWEMLARRLHFAYGCCYWQMENKLLKLDVNTMEISTVDLPPGHDDIAIVQASDGSLGMFSRIFGTEGATSMKYYTLMQKGSGRANEWNLMNTIPMVDYRLHGFMGSAGGFLFLKQIPQLTTTDRQLCLEDFCSSFEIKTSNIERVCRTRSFNCFPYFGFPPSMSPRRIQGCEVAKLLAAVVGQGIREGKSEEGSSRSEIRGAESRQRQRRTE
ncbi:unnamed protein product [Urochloa humidicola]